MSRIWLGKKGNEIELSPLNRTFNEEEFEITREDRTASGRLVIDVIATKKRFKLDYSTTTGMVLSQLQEIYQLGAILNLRVERQDGVIDEYEVKLRPFSRSRFLAVGDWRWKDISLELEEI